ncbi:MAG: type II toxin-antitoxin system VapC family toxin [Candidatus Melainabacteria bacterium]|nr:MAG: type II toxin-antitoxin system VapC family toxin [Candidatus Melainabacteria bacterium]
MKYLVDTCVISELAKTDPNANVVRWIDSQELNNIHLSVITIGEIRRGIEKLKDGTRKNRLQSWLEDELLSLFGSRLLHIDLEVAICWGELTATLDQLGKPMPAVDSLIAATALKHQCVLVTRNVEDFKNSKVELFNPWNFVN